MPHLAGDKNVKVSSMIGNFIHSSISCVTYSASHATNTVCIHSAEMGILPVKFSKGRMRLSSKFVRVNTEYNCLNKPLICYFIKPIQSKVFRISQIVFCMQKITEKVTGCHFRLYSGLLVSYHSVSEKAIYTPEIDRACYR